jgi:hypothetical protein
MAQPGDMGRRDEVRSEWHESDTANCKPALSRPERKREGLSCLVTGHSRPSAAADGRGDDDRNLQSTIENLKSLEGRVKWARTRVGE